MHNVADSFLYCCLALTNFPILENDQLTFRLGLGNDPDILPGRKTHQSEDSFFPDDVSEVDVIYGKNLIPHLQALTRCWTSVENGSDEYAHVVSAGEPNTDVFTFLERDLSSGRTEIKSRD